MLGTENVGLKTVISNTNLLSEINDWYMLNDSITLSLLRIQTFFEFLGHIMKSQFFKVSQMVDSRWHNF